TDKRYRRTGQGIACVSKDVAIHLSNAAHHAFRKIDSDFSIDALAQRMNASDWKLRKDCENPQRISLFGIRLQDGDRQQVLRGNEREPNRFLPVARFQRKRKTCSKITARTPCDLANAWRGE
ncbi:hypothetical protein, partial [Nitratireductor sp. ZSWI3]|uniref:hypothetical protein n=1 Tax=Nitratireductor sp. ZSWI3 TaxID=2966359 RepID=UPI0021501D7E